MKAPCSALLALGVAVTAAPAAGDAPEIYRKVAGVHWVVRDLPATKAAWARLGFRSLRDLGELSVAGSFRGQSGTTRLRAASACLAGLDVLWLQPLDGHGAPAEFLARHGEGIFSLNYEAPSVAALEAEVSRLSSLGVGVLERGELPLGGETETVVYMDTESQGKYVLGIVHAAAPGSAGPAQGRRVARGGCDAGQGPSFPVKLTQYALVVERLQPVSDFWARLGWPAMEVTHPALGDLRYHGQPGQFDQKLGWHRHGSVTWEWIEPLRGPTVYADFLKAHGEGFHHLGLEVPDIDAATRAWEGLGVPVVQSGSWGERGKPGFGRFAYADTTAAGGVTIELLWSQR